MKPRVWTVFVAFVVIGIAIQAAVMSTGLVSAWWLSGETQLLHLFNHAAALEQTYSGFVLCRFPAHLVLLAATVFLGWHSPEKWTDRLGLVRCQLSMGQWLVLSGATLVPLLLSFCLAAVFVRLLQPPGNEGSISWWSAGLYVGYMTFIPSFVEELFFRGYIQRRLLQRWSIAPSLLTTAVLFTVAHGITPVILVTVFPVALWLGVLAWRTGSIWPGCVCHAWLNFLWCGWPVIHQLMGASPVLSVSFAAYLVMLSGLCFLLTAHWLRDRQTPAIALPSVRTQPGRENSSFTKLPVHLQQPLRVGVHGLEWRRCG